MGEPTETVVMEGGPADGETYDFPTGQGSRVRFPSDHDREAWREVSRRVSQRNLAWIGLAAWPAGPEPDPARLCITYTDSGRRTADGRRVFTVEGG